MRYTPMREEIKRARELSRHSWFAWYPVRTARGQWVWLERVNRHRVIKEHAPKLVWSYE